MTTYDIAVNKGIVEGMVKGRVEGEIKTRLETFVELLINLPNCSNVFLAEITKFNKMTIVNLKKVIQTNKLANWKKEVRKLFKKVPNLTPEQLIAIDKNASVLWNRLKKKSAKK